MDSIISHDHIEYFILVCDKYTDVTLFPDCGSCLIKDICEIGSKEYFCTKCNKPISPLYVEIMKRLNKFIDQKDWLCCECYDNLR